MASLLTRNVSYEGPALRKQLAKAQQLQQELSRREVECQRSAAELRERYYTACRQYGISVSPGHEPYAAGSRMTPFNNPPCWFLLKGWKCSTRASSSGEGVTRRPGEGREGRSSVRGAHSALRRFHKLCVWLVGSSSTFTVLLFHVHKNTWRIPSSRAASFVSLALKRIFPTSKFQFVLLMV